MLKNFLSLDSWHPFRALIVLAALLLSTACSGGTGPTVMVTPVEGVSRSESQAASTEAPAALAGTGATRPAATEPALLPTQAETTVVEPAAETASPPLACTAPVELTPAMTEGPYFKAGSPEDASLFEDGMAGTRLVLSGYVLTTDCQPVANALVDIWQADAQGNYDNAGYRLRGHVFTDATGRYQVETVVPGEYPGRTEHIHVKVQGPGGPVLTTQLFFPGVQHNETDRIFSDKLLLEIQDTPDGVQGIYNFVIATS